MNMLNLNKLSRRQWGAIVFVLVCCGASIFLGRYAVIESLNEMQRENAEKLPQSDLVFALPIVPLEKDVSIKSDKSNSEIRLNKDPKDAPKDIVDLTALRIWEIAVRQPLPPRKDPLTPPRWRIVGVTSVGVEKSVLLLFENQPATEAKKIGDKLPGGAKIIEIAQDHLKISLNGQSMKLNLRKQ
ncbi:hypothetical protein LPB67_14250 [Undibacterium sp. Jales W-56]|uniref:hypothetical protein n=1 Tax=Undibacterium sp. Jales W-56 TaxID=2897325 RepID=UPI0021CEFB79|nr:hypothetical protein [Undibacterium sp. Jales W-56]MCU6434935.1 hypothetical protein [Undibacterium sp. Jales W-56]